MTQYLYIPFNSLNFNSVFSTLSISPQSFYERRNFGFRRNELSSLNHFKNSLLAYSKLPLITANVDRADGFPIYLKVRKDKLPNAKLAREENEISIYQLNETIHLYSDFEVIFRSSEELDETLAKSLRSVETKYVQVFKNNFKLLRTEPEQSIIRFEDHFLENIYDITSPNQDAINRDIFLNKVQGFIIAYGVGKITQLPLELQKAQILLRELRNALSIYINNISGRNTDESFNKQSKVDRKPLYSIIDSLVNILENKFPLDKQLESKFQSNGLTAEILNSIKSIKIFDKSIYEMVIDFLGDNNKAEVPIIIYLSKLKTLLQKGPYPKYPESHVQNVNTLFIQIEDSFDRIRSDSFNDRKFNPATELVFSDFQLKSAKISDNPFESEAYRIVINYLLKREDIATPEDLITTKEKTLVDIGQQLSASLPDFKSSKERDYLLKDVLPAIKSLVTKFEITNIHSPVFQSIALLILRNSDLTKFTDNVDKIGFDSKHIPYSFWGAALGAANLPKTFTDSLINSKAGATIFSFMENMVAGNYINEEMGNNQQDYSSTSLDNYKITTTFPPTNNERVLLQEALNNLELKPEYKDWVMQCFDNNKGNNSDLADLIENQLEGKGKPKNFGKKQINSILKQLDKINVSAGS